MPNFWKSYVYAKVQDQGSKWLSKLAKFEGLFWGHKMDGYVNYTTTPMTTSARTFVIQKNPISTFCDNFWKIRLKKENWPES